MSSKRNVHNARTSAAVDEESDSDSDSDDEQDRVSIFKSHYTFVCKSSDPSHVSIPHLSNNRKVEIKVSGSLNSRTTRSKLAPTPMEFSIPLFSSCCPSSRQFETHPLSKTQQQKKHCSTSIKRRKKTLQMYNFQGLSHGRILRSCMWIRLRNFTCHPRTLRLLLDPSFTFRKIFATTV